VGGPLWRGDRSDFCICCWPLPAQSFSCPSPFGLATIIYCLRFEIYLFVATYDSQGHGGGIRPHLHMGISRSHPSRAEQSSSLLPATSQHGHSWHRAPLGPMAIYLFNAKTFVFLSLSLSLMLRPTVSRPVRLGIKHPSGAYDQIFFSVRNTEYVWQLRSWFRGALSLTRGRVCLLYILLALASAVFLRSESLGNRDHILLSQIWDFPFRRLLRLTGSRWRYSTPPPHLPVCVSSRMHSVLYLLDVPTREHWVEQFIPPLSRKRPLCCCENRRLSGRCHDNYISTVQATSVYVA
jgi:hypothetical protein